MSDYHVHLHPHVDPDGTEGPPVPGTVEAFVEAAAARGVTEIGFTEHLYRCREASAVLGPFWEGDTPADLATFTAEMVAADLTLTLDSYVETVTVAKEQGLPVKLGLEVDFFPDTIEAVMDLLEPYPWDFLIGSVHNIGGWTVDAGGSAHEFERRGVERAWEEYFALETQLAASGSVDVLAHVDVVKKYGYRPPAEPTGLYRAVVAAAAASGTAVEVSSQGLRNPAAEVYPAPALLSMFHAAGVPITLASDAHVPDQAGWGHAEVVEAARAAGYSSHLRFEARRPVPVPLP